MMSKITHGCLLYKCRRCGEISESFMSGDIDGYLKRIIANPTENTSLRPTMLGFHLCSDDGLEIGIADLIGAIEKSVVDAFPQPTSTPQESEDE